MELNEMKEFIVRCIKSCETMEQHLTAADMAHRYILRRYEHSVNKGDLAIVLDEVNQALEDQRVQLVAMQAHILSIPTLAYQINS